MTFPAKSTLRQRCVEYRTRLSDEDYATRSTAIRKRAADWPPLQRGTMIHAYWPMTEEREVDIRPIIRSLHDRGTQVVLPMVTTFATSNGDTPAMEHRRFTGEENLATNRWDLREPVNGERVSPNELDGVIVPALGADRRGHRIGHGYGYYDTFLRDVDAPTLALVYNACLVDRVPADAHDVAVDCVITETETICPDGDFA